MCSFHHLIRDFLPPSVIFIIPLQRIMTLLQLIELQRRDDSPSLIHLPDIELASAMDQRRVVVDRAEAPSFTSLTSLSRVKMSPAVESSEPGPIPCQFQPRSAIQFTTASGL